jgi:hypothetical protein
MPRRYLAAALLIAALVSGRADAQKFVKQASIQSLPAPVLLDTAGMFQDKYAKVGDDLVIAGQPT